jgi:glutamate racemase
MKKRNSAPIGIFDSGIGGLTVVKAVMEAMPEENIIYFGDTARVPYGIKSIETIREYALQITDFLLKRNIKLILIACNSVSAAANDEIREYAGSIPVLDVVEAGSIAALKAPSSNNRIGVIGTLATISSGTYEKSIKAKNPEKRNYSRACPLLVPLAEEGWINDKISDLVLEEYLKDFKNKEMDTLILGCTHYPLFKDQIQNYLKETNTQVIDSAISIADMAKKLLTEKNLLNVRAEGGTFECYVSDKPQRFQTLAERFLGKKLNRIDIVSLK